MNIIIAGAGTVGKQLAGRLCDEGHNIIIIDNHYNNLRQLEEYYDLQTVTGDAASVEILRDVHVDQADLVLGITENDSTNVLICKLAKELGAKKRVARIRHSECFSDPSIMTPHDMGIDMSIFPEKEAAEEIENLLNRPYANQSFRFLNDHVEILNINICEDHKILHMYLNEVVALTQIPFRFVCIQRKKEAIIPIGWDGQLAPGDKLFIAAQIDQIPKLIFDLGLEEAPHEKIFIYGGTNIGMTVARSLESKPNKKVSIIESSRTRTKEMAYSLNKTLVLHGEGTDTNLLEGEGVSQAEMFIAVTSDENTNILSCLLAKKLGVKKTICLVAKPDFVPLISELNIDTIISQRLITINKIMQFIRRGSISAVEEIIENDIIALQFRVTEETLVTDIPLSSPQFRKDFPSNAIITGVMRRINIPNSTEWDEEVIIPDGNTSLLENDKVLVVCKKSKIHKLEQFFA